MPVSFLRPNEKPIIPAEMEKFSDDLTARVYEAQAAQLREAGERMGNDAVRAHKRKSELDPEVDENYVHPGGLRRSSRLMKSARLI